jgi:2-polyprenyl-6-methoxyphenol hydroxylase-like FAD-dependent oxidoreductase
MAHAIVVGGSVAGPLTARVLADHYEQVTIVERDILPRAGNPRPGFPHGRHSCALLGTGRQMLDQLFPGISEDLIAAGALMGDSVGDCPCRLAGGIAGLLVSSPLLEETILDRVVSRSNVRLLQGSVVRGLAARGGRVLGIKVDGGETIPAELVVDSTGSHGPRWLEEIGYPKPPEDRIAIGPGQTTRQFHRRPADLNGGLAVMIYTTPKGELGGAMAALEGNRWRVTFASERGAYAPPKLESFIEFGRRLPAAYTFRTLLNAEPVEEFATMWFPTNLRRRYEKLETFPEGFVVLGGVISGADPVFGQGLSSIAAQLSELAKTLADGRDALGRRFFPRVAMIDGALPIPETAGPQSARVNLANWRLSKLHTTLFRLPDRYRRGYSRGLQWARIA